MSTINLERLFNPKSVAVVGTSEKKGSVGFSIIKNLVESGFKGDIFPVNPKYKRIMGLACLVKSLFYPRAVLSVPLCWILPNVKMWGLVILSV